jgi:hypothetical protein
MQNGPIEPDDATNQTRKELEALKASLEEAMRNAGNSDDSSSEKPSWTVDADLIVSPLAGGGPTLLDAPEDNSPAMTTRSNFQDQGEQAALENTEQTVVVARYM